jgi:dipeptidyl aminopeptidase/acylaminoacyl peptidase
MYRIDLETGGITLEATNPSDVLTWTSDNNFVIRAATAFDGRTANTIIRVRDGIDKPWRDLVVIPFDRALLAGEVVEGSLIAGFDPDGKSLIIHSALHANNGRLVRVDLRTGEELSVLAEDRQSDIADAEPGIKPSVIVHPITHTVQAVEFEYTTRHWLFLDPKLQAEFEKVGRTAPGFPKLVSRDRADQLWIIAVQRDNAADSYYTYNRSTGELKLLFEENPRLKEFGLIPKTPVVIKVRDGLGLVSYLTVPSDSEKLPLVLLIHGGPWFRDRDVYEPEVQFLANRGYAVLQVNYRGSTGLGIDYLNAANNQWGRGTQQDLYDAAQWAIDNQIADPKRIAAMGWSGGGFATLRALEMRPDLFACGVDGVGPADVAASFRSFPAYWSNILTRWRRRAGDVDHDEALNRAISPLYHIDSIRAPLLIGQGQNDPRVPIANPDAMCIPTKGTASLGRKTVSISTVAWRNS